MDETVYDGNTQYMAYTIYDGEMSDEDPIEQIPRGIALAWGVAATPQRGPKREMSVERIVEAAIEIADQDGIQAVSMSAVAKRLGYTPMSLYRYVSAKDDLLLLMQEEATGLPPEDDDPALPWRERLLELYRAQTRIYAEQPWLLALPIQGSPITPNSSAWLEAGLAALRATELTQDEKIAASLLVTGAARWKGTILAGYREKSRSTGLSAAEVSDRESRLFDAVITSDGYPALREAIDAGVFTSEADPFDFGLERSLDGLAAFIDRVGRERGAHEAEEANAEARNGSASGQLDCGASGAQSPQGEAGDAVRSGEGGQSADLAEEDPEVLADKRYREARKAVRQAQKILAEARKRERQTLREARERAEKNR